MQRGLIRREQLVQQHEFNLQDYLAPFQETQSALPSTLLSPPATAATSASPTEQTSDRDLSTTTAAVSSVTPSPPPGLPVPQIRASSASPSTAGGLYTPLRSVYSHKTSHLKTPTQIHGASSDSHTASEARSSVLNASLSSWSSSSPGLISPPSLYHAAIRVDEKEIITDKVKEPNFTVEHY